MALGGLLAAAPRECFAEDGGLSTPSYLDDFMKST
jgi:hypothetical protein